MLRIRRGAPPPSVDSGPATAFRTACAASAPRREASKTRRVQGRREITRDRRTSLLVSSLFSFQRILKSKVSCKKITNTQLEVVARAKRVLAGHESNMSASSGKFDLQV